MIMNLSKTRFFIEKEKFRFSHSSEDIGYDVYTKGKSWRLIVFYMNDDKPLDVPRFWLIKDEKLTKFEGFIDNADDFKIVLRLVKV